MTTTQRIEAETQAQRDAFHVKEFCTRVGISPSTFWKAHRQKEIRTFKVCGRVLVPAAELDRLLSGKAA